MTALVAALTLLAILALLIAVLERVAPAPEWRLRTPARPVATRSMVGPRQSRVAFQVDHHHAAGDDASTRP
jgi:hypothetical protein